MTHGLSSSDSGCTCRAGGFCRTVDNLLGTEFTEGPLTQGRQCACLSGNRGPGYCLPALLTDLEPASLL